MDATDRRIVADVPHAIMQPFPLFPGLETVGYL